MGKNPITIFRLVAVVAIILLTSNVIELNVFAKGEFANSDAVEKSGEKIIDGDRGLGEALWSAETESRQVETEGNAFRFKKAEKSDDLGYVRIKDARKYDFGSEDFTITLWIRTDSEDGGTIIYRGDYDQGRYYALVMNSEGTIYFTTGNEDGTVTVETKEALNDGKKHFVSAQRTGDGLRVYVDGQLKALTFAEPLDISNNGSLSIGSDMGDYDFSQTPRMQFEGDIGQIRIWAKALSQSRMNSLEGLGKPKGDNKE
ncbi:LamG domain-containing protein [Candidatus Micrarchaeota archaeon]|nr:LamG domain-containing protein [Candidatus Micrarchaeota archaeon]